MICFRRHVISANEKLTMPLSEQLLNLVVIPIIEFVYPIIDDPQLLYSVCITGGLWIVTTGVFLYYNN